AARTARPEEHPLELARVAPGAAPHHGEEVLPAAAPPVLVLMVVLLWTAAVAAPFLSMRVHVVVLSSIVRDASTIYRDSHDVKGAGSSLVGPPWHPYARRPCSPRS